jgi:RIO kinase 1
MFLDGVLLMELVAGADGEPAPRLVDTQLTVAEANAGYHDMLKQLVLILSCELIHGDLSPYNVLLGAQGHTIIDFPQIISASHNSQSEMFFLRDARNILGYYASIDPSLAARQSDPAEIWRAYVRRELSPDFMPSGRGGPPARTEGRPHQRTHAGPHGAPPARAQGGPHGAQPQRTQGAQPQRTHGAQPQRTHGAQPQRTHGAQPQRTHGAQPQRAHAGAPPRTQGGPAPRTQGGAASHGQIGGPAFPSRMEHGSSARNNQPRPAAGPGGGHGGRSQAPIRHGGQQGGGARPPANVRGPRMPEVIVLANRPLQSPSARPAAEDRASPVPGAPSTPAPAKGPRRRRRRGGNGGGGNGGGGQR